MSDRIDWVPSVTLPDRQEVLHLQGIPPGVELPPRIAAIVDSAMNAYLETAEPRALVAGLSRETFAGILKGEGKNAPETPVEAVALRADALSLFVATVGGRVTERIQALFSENEPALAAMLDSVASAAADRLTQLLAERYPAVTAADTGQTARSAPRLRTGHATTPDRRVTLGYSPGYCGWHVSGQRALFAFLQPATIGVTLNDSCLMDPLKSVSGVLASGASDIHRFSPGYPFCADCRDKPCVGRIKPERAHAGNV